MRPFYLLRKEETMLKCMLLNQRILEKDSIKAMLNNKIVLVKFIICNHVSC